MLAHFSDKNVSVFKLTIESNEPCSHSLNGGYFKISSVRDVISTRDLDDSKERGDVLVLSQW
jgi:hypothetical protein